MWIILWIMLGYYSWQDIRKKELTVKSLVAGLVVSCMVAAIRGWQAGSIRVGTEGLLPGAALLALAMLSGGRLGIGDGIVLLIIGNMAGLEKSVLILLAAVMGAFAFSCILLIFFRKGKNDCFPFVPFYALGAGIVGVMDMWKG